MTCTRLNLWHGGTFATGRPIYDVTYCEDTPSALRQIVDEMIGEGYGQAYCGTVFLDKHGMGSAVVDLSDEAEQAAREEGHGPVLDADAARDYREAG